MTSTATMTMRYEGPSAEAVLAATRSLGLGLTTVGPTVTGDRATFTTSVPTTVSWVQVLSLIEVLGSTRSPFDYIDSSGSRHVALSPAGR